MYKDKKILAVTLARGGSKGIPNKNITPINGKPLINYTLEQVKLCNLIDWYIVSTDSNSIKEIVEACGVECPFLRPEHLASDTATSADALIHAVEYLSANGMNFDYVVEVMATNPLKNVEDITNCIQLAIDNKADSCVAVNRLYDQHPSRIKYIEDNKLKPFFPEIPETRRQDLKPLAYIRSGSIYVTSVNFLLETRSRYSSDDTYAYVLPDDRVINIDEPRDLDIARIALK